MPEGPEVRVIADELNFILKDVKLMSVKILSGKYCGKRKIDNLEEFTMNLPLKIIDIKTKGKMIYFQLEKNWFIFNSLGMSGTWSPVYVNHCHIEFEYLNKNNKLSKIWFFDIRRFGNIYFSNDPIFISNKLNSIGQDMLSSPPNLNYFKDLLKKKNNWNICKVLMDQSIISGIGNYIKSEVLYRSKISPYKKVSELSDEQLNNLYKSILYVIKTSYQHQGTTLSTYKHVKGTSGKFSDFLKVYNKKETEDKFKIEKIKTPDGRSTFWVPQLQD